MNFLFDISPEEPPDEKKKAKKAGKSGAAEGVCADDPSAGAAPGRALIEIIGTSDDHYDCADETCGSRIFDILDEWKGEWYVQCMICGTCQYVPAIPGVIKVPDVAGEFVFADGKFEGRSISEASAMQHGMKYIEWAAASHKREAVRTACKNWLDAISPSP